MHSTRIAWCYTTTTAAATVKGSELEIEMHERDDEFSGPCGPGPWGRSLFEGREHGQGIWRLFSRDWVQDGYLRREGPGHLDFRSRRGFVQDQVSIKDQSPPRKHVFHDDDDHDDHHYLLLNSSISSHGQSLQTQIRLCTLRVAPKSPAPFIIPPQNAHHEAASAALPVPVVRVAFEIPTAERRYHGLPRRRLSIDPFGRFSRRYWCLLPHFQQRTLVVGSTARQHPHLPRGGETVVGRRGESEGREVADSSEARGIAFRRNREYTGEEKRREDVGGDLPAVFGRGVAERYCSR